MMPEASPVYGISALSYHSNNSVFERSKTVRRLLPICRLDSDEPNLHAKTKHVLKRRMILGISTVLSIPPAAYEAKSTPEESKMVGAFLRGSQSITGFVDFVADKSRTPALRAGVLNPYAIALPMDWVEVPVSNARSGNYCQPRCDEATLEVQFAERNSGSVQIIIIPITKLMITKKNPTIGDVGTLSSVLNAISPSITGSVAIEDEEIVDMATFEIENKTYYVYEALTPFAEMGPHNLACVTTNKNYIIILACSANEKQWNNSEQVES